MNNMLTMIAFWFAGICSLIGGIIYSFEGDDIRFFNRFCLAMFCFAVSAIINVLNKKDD